MAQATTASVHRDPVYMGMKGDISQAIDRRMDLFALTPAKGHMVRSFIGWAYQEARRKRKKPIFLAPMKDIEWIKSSIIEVRGGSKGGEGIVAIGKGILSCLDDTSYVDPSDILNHCFRKGTIEDCPFQAGFDLETYREARKSGGAVLSEIHDDMREMGMCPARTALDLAVESDALVVNYSFLFTEDWKSVMKFIERDPKDTVLIVYDPSSFIKYIEKKNTYRFRGEDLIPGKFALSGLSETERSSIEILLELLSDLAFRPDPKQQIARRLLIEKFTDRAKEAGIPHHLSSATGALKKSLRKGQFKNISERKRTKDLYMMLKLWMGQYSGVSRIRAEREDGDYLEVSLIDLSVFTNPLLSSFSSLLLFGDTLYPHTIYSYRLGIGSDRIMNRSYIDKEFMEGTSILSLGNVDTSFKNRNEASYQRIAENLSSISDTTKGLKLAVMPSYFIMEQVMDAMAGIGFNHPVIEETRGLAMDQRNELLEEVKVGGDLIALTVQGGFLERSMRNGNLSPDTVILVGLHIPPPDPRSSQMKVHLQKKFGPNIGHIISVLMPAIDKVMITVNGMVSPDVQRDNLVVLMDRRYHDRRILECLPRFYDIKLLNDIKEFEGSRFIDRGGHD